MSLPLKSSLKVTINFLIFNHFCPNHQRKTVGNQEIKSAFSGDSRANTWWRRLKTVYKVLEL